MQLVEESPLSSSFNPPIPIQVGHRSSREFFWRYLPGSSCLLQFANLQLLGLPIAHAQEHQTDPSVPPSNLPPATAAAWCWAAAAVAEPAGAAPAAVGGCCCWAPAACRAEDAPCWPAPGAPGGGGWPPGAPLYMAGFGFGFWVDLRLSCY